MPAAARISQDWAIHRHPAWRAWIAAAGLLAGCFGGGDDHEPAPAQPPAGGGSIVAGSSASIDQNINHPIGRAAPMPGATPLSPVADTADPQSVLGAARIVDNPYQPGGRGANSPFPLDKLAGLTGPFPTGKWTKGFHYMVLGAGDCAGYWGHGAGC